jgi:hypothetical protein
MSKVNEIITELDVAPELKDWLRIVFPQLVQMGKDQAAIWLSQFAGPGWEQALEQMLEKMSNEELSSMETEGNAALARLNAQQWADINARNDAIIWLATIGLELGAAAI